MTSGGLSEGLEHPRGHFSMFGVLEGAICHGLSTEGASERALSLHCFKQGGDLVVFVPSSLEEV